LHIIALAQNSLRARLFCASRFAGAFVAALLLLALQAAPVHAQDDDPPFPATETPALAPLAEAELADAQLAVDATPPVVINELHYNHDVDTEWVEFVELYNRASVAVGVGNWTLSGAVGYTFPPGATIPARGYLVVAQSPQALAGKYGASSLGPYTGRLSGDGEQLVLRDQNAAEVDEVEYGIGFPWPTVGYSPARSIQLMNPAFDSSVAGNWRSAPPTPGRANAVLTANAPPQVLSVSHAPQQPKQGEAVIVTVTVADSDGVEGVRLLYQAVAPGQYIALYDGAYQTTWTPLQMEPQGDGSFRVQMPPALSKHRTLVRYRIEASDRGGRRVVLPYPDDPQPNFAYFVYQGLPLYYASLRPGEPQLTFDFNAMRSLPAYLFLTKENEVADAMFMPPSPWATGYMGSEYFWRGTLVYNGQVYDHVRYRARGGATRYATGKTMWKINFNPGHRFQAYDNFGAPYPLKWDKLNLSSVIQQTHRDRRGEQGMFESMTYRLFQMAGVPAPNTHWAQLRVIDTPYEISGSQYTGDFWGLYLAVEQPDGFFLERNGLPDGNLYKMEGGTGELNNLGRYGPADKSDLNAFMATYQFGNPSAEWWRTVVDLESYYSYRSILEFTHHYDLDEGKNYIYYRNPEANRWTVLPWDVDLTWYEEMPGKAQEPFALPVLGRLEFNLEYQNRMRELRDLLLNPEQIFAMLDEHAAVVDTPINGLSMVDADRFMWDYNPIYGTRYVDPLRTGPGQFYARVPVQSFRGLVEDMKRFAYNRMVWIDNAILTDRDHPATPGIGYAGDAGFPVDGLRFSAGAYADPQGPATFAAMEWRIAEVTNPAAPAYKPGDPRLYEVQPVWESGPLTVKQSVLTPPPGVLQSGHAYRVRVRYMDNSWRWSHWSAPVEFIAAPPRVPLNTALQITELMYNPLPQGNQPEDRLEFIEITNASGQTVVLDNMRLTGGVEFYFPVGARLAPNRALVLVRDAAAFRQRYGFNADAKFDKRLSNGGDTVTLLDAFGRTIFTVTYDDEAPWPESADGGGYSLVYSPLGGAPDNPAAWRASTDIHGSPGAVDPPPVRINEVLLSPPTSRAVELYNPLNVPADVSGWFISDELGDPRKVLLPAGTIIPAGGYRVIPANILATASFDGRMVIDPTGLVTLRLFAADASGQVQRYSNAMDIPVTEAGVSVGRITDSVGGEHVVAQAQPTLGNANGAPRVGPLVISEIMYNPPGDTPEYVELTNISAAPLPLFDAATGAGWLLHGGSFTIPAGITLPPGGRLLLTAQPALDACTRFGGRGHERILGPLQWPLNNSGQTVSLSKPTLIPGAGSAFTEIDAITYKAVAPWPAQAAGQGAAMRRVNLSAFGDDPANWQPQQPPPGAAATPAGAALCALVVERGADGVSVRWMLSSSTGVTGFRLWRSSQPDRSGAVEVPVTPTAVATAPADPAPADSAPADSAPADSGPADPALGDLLTAIAANVPYRVIDPTAPADAPLYYFLDAEVGAGTVELGFSAPLEATNFQLLPVVKR
jgi:hypothetical protein